MTRPPEPDPTVEQRLSAALHVLAETQVPDATDRDENGDTPRRRTRVLSVAAALLIIIGGGVGIALLGSEPTSTDGQPAATADPASSSTPSSQPSATDSTVGVAPAPSSPIEQPSDPEASDPELVGVLDPDAGFGPGTTLSEVDRWLAGGIVGNRRFAIQRNGTGEPVGLEWTVLPTREWTKSFADQPTVELADGRTAKRLVPTMVDIVVYAIETGEGVFSASFTPSAEVELARWFSDVAGTDADTITPPEGYAPIADLTDQRTVSYGDGTTVTTFTFEHPIELADYAATRLPGFSLEPIGDRGAVVATPGNDRDLRNDSVIDQPRADIIVTASGPQDDLERIADAIAVTDLASADLIEDTNTSDPNLAADPDLVVLGETSEGRFGYTRTMLADGTACSSFLHDRYGGTGGCGDERSARSGPICTTGWSAPDEATASAFVLSDADVDIEFTIDGRPLDANIETGVDNGVAWIFASAHEDGHPIDDPSIEVTVDRSRC